MGDENKGNMATGNENPVAQDTGIEAETDQKNTDTTSTNETVGFTKEQVDELLKKARSDEKTKAFSAIEELKKNNDEVQKRLDELEKSKKEIEKDRDFLREGRSTELKSVNEELAQLRSQNEELQKSFSAAVEQSAKKIREHELKAYRAEKLRESGIELSELVSGNSEEEIDAAISKAKEREKAIEAKLRAEIEASVKKNLPKPVSPDGTYGRGPAEQLTVKSRQQAARMTPEEFAKWRQQQLQEALQKANT